MIDIERVDNIPACFIPLEDTGMVTELPALFTFPFHYTPHPLSILAAQDLQNYIQTQKNWRHDFGIANNSVDGLGKMFGVLIVKNNEGKLGYLAAFSGKLAGENHHQRFVPPVFDILEKDGFFRKEEEEINQINRRVEALEQDDIYLTLKKSYNAASIQCKTEVETLKIKLKEAKSERDARRIAAQNTLNAADFAALDTALNAESAHFYFQLKDLNRAWKRRLADIDAQIIEFQTALTALKEERKHKSAQLQQKIFDHYTFLNAFGEHKSLNDIFDAQPPAGAGECAAPKLLHYAFLHQLTPVAMAEFWWGKSPVSEIRQHAHFYPACNSKCAPILAHMLKGTAVERDPLADLPTAKIPLPIIFEDTYLLVVNKPAEFLSIPGKKATDSVYSRVKDMFPDATGPLIAHRLDMSTSGLMVVAKTKEAHQHLQSQFTKRRVTKRYVALLDGILTENEGMIDLPLRVDLEDRPRQLVCFDHGKPAQTRWEVVERLENKTKVHFFPITGRTHQLRVHAAHAQGLNAPILGDELYGRRGERLYLHAESLTFLHPNTEGVMHFEAPAPF